ncbi:ASE1 [Candida margitis]|uniref:ASE1 n=1 Tax=Candida margitis TaxID=1775924 RepID=UPI002227879A|nr:ASE1 [Candida margitis]KAI5960232.1 ASE1 [Candida margitis]
MASIQSTPKSHSNNSQVTTEYFRSCSRSPIEEIERMVSSSTLAADDQSRLQEGNDDDEDMNSQFDSIEFKINNAISELESIYKVIGYSSSEMKLKKAEIFTIVQDTINNFANNLQREKNTIENECEWLKQQIQVILSMVNDSKGDKSLSLLQKGLVFNNHQQYIDGYKEQILSKMTSSAFQQSKLGDELTLEQQYDYMVKNIPELNLLESRSRLNVIFIDVLKIFVRLYKQYNSLNIECAKLVVTIGISEFDPQVISTMPPLNEAEMHREVMEEFGNLIMTINTTQTPDQNENDIFVLASPVKSSSSQESNYTHDGSSQVNIKRLREVNYQLVRIMRSLKFTRISTDLIQSLQREIKVGRESLDVRKSTIVEVIHKCLDSIEFLQLSDDHLAELQKNEIGGNEGFLDRQTLGLILRDPLEFGLHDENINHLIQIQNLVDAKITEKRDKWKSYSDSCMQLWKRLGESDEYIDNFMSSNNNLSDLSLLNFKMELNRLYIKRSEYIESFISDTRVEIESLWDKMFYSQGMRSEFQYFNYDPDNDDGEDKETVLNIHEDEVKKLNEEYNQKAPVLQVYDELQDLIKDQKFLQESSRDSSRLLSKNSCKILLNEEKIRKRINKTMPRVIESLKSEVKKYNNRVVQEGKRTLMMNSKDFFEEVLRLESELLNSGSNRVKPKSASTSPIKRPNTSSRNFSPEKKPKSRFMSTKIPPAAPTGTRAKIIKSPTNTRQTTSTTTARANIHTNSTTNNSTTLRSLLSSSSNSAINSSTLSANSPISATRTSSFTSKPPTTELKPLTSPLKMSTTNLNTQGNSRSIKRFTNRPNQYSSGTSEEKENNSTDTYSNNNNNNIGKIDEIAPGFVGCSRERVSSVGTTSIGNDTSTMIGDDYFAWRDEKIKQLNDI